MDSLANQGSPLIQLPSEKNFLISMKYPPMSCDKQGDECKRYDLQEKFMKRYICIGVVTLSMGLTIPAMVDGSAQKDINGTWLGTMKIPSGPELRLVVDIERRANGSLAADLTSIDQGGSLPMDKVEFEENRLRISVRSPEIVIEGTIAPDGSVFTAEFCQGPAKFSVRFEAVDDVPGFPRPQRPKGPYPYDEEEVSFQSSAAVRIAGTLTRPRGRASVPAVLLVAGSGPQNRNELIAYHRPFHVWADHLTRQGFAVLRVDKRGVGDSTGDYNTSNSEDLAKDVMAGIEYLKTRSDIDAQKIGLIGHSEGGTIAAMVAARTADIAFIVMLAGPGIPAADILYYQDGAEVKAEGASEEKVAMTRSWWQQM